MAALGPYYNWDLNAPEWTYTCYYDPTADQAALEALKKRRRREARAERDRQVIRSLSRLQATRAQQVIEERRWFGRIVGKRLMERARRRRA